MNDVALKRWRIGDVVLFRGLRQSRVEWAIGTIIVRDDPELVAMFWRSGTPNVKPKTRPSPQDLISNNFEIIHSQWEETDVLMLAPSRAAHAIYVMWEAGQRKLRCWYVDLHKPLRRTRLGFDTTDHTLDIVISVDKTEWHWKDEDEFAEETKLGIYSAEEANSIRAEGQRVVDLIKTGQSPIFDGWEKWTPPVNWNIPSIPDGWDVIDK